LPFVVADSRDANPASHDMGFHMFDRSVTAAAQAHGLAEYPREAAGLVVDGVYVPCGNLAEDPTTDFAIDAGLVRDLGARVEGLIHSHPGDWPVPTAGDMRQQQAMDIPWGIYSVDLPRDEDRKVKPGRIAPDHLYASPVVWFGRQVPKGPLVSRPGVAARGFCHGHTDCVSAILDWHALQGIDLPEPPRSWEWWLADENGKRGDLYRDNFEGYGFQRIDGPVIGAVALMALGVERDASGRRRKVAVLNHAGVLVEDDLFLHHLTGRDPIDPGRLCCREPFGLWRDGSNVPIVWVRYRDLPIKGLKRLS
jgi:proteasome lid subunit RPN8/RPN11